MHRHIEILLLSHECVIVPGFGGFIAHHEDARYDEDDKLWLPPYRTLGFNQQLTLNDSLLVQSYVEAYDMSYPDALRMVEAEVDEMKAALRNDGEYELVGLGTLSVNIEGNYDFTPCEAGILSPEEYGLADFKFLRLKEGWMQETATVEDVKEQKAEEQPAETSSHALLDFTDSDEADNDSTALTIKMSWVRNAVAIAAAIACFFLLATPVANSDLGNKTMSQLQGNIIYKLMPKDSNMMPAKPVVEEEKEEVKEDVKEGVKEDVKEVKDTYCIVLASQVKRSNAEEYVEKLKKRGIADARIYIENDMLRVVCGQYDDQAEAYNQVNKMSQEEEFAEVWVLKIKKN